MITESRGTFRVHATRTRPALAVSADGAGVVSHAGSRLLADLADRTTLTAQLCAVSPIGWSRRRCTTLAGC